MKSTAPGSIPHVTRTSQAHIPAHSDKISPDARFTKLPSPARSQQESLAGKRVFRRTTPAPGPIEGEEGRGKLQQHVAELEGSPAYRLPVAERVAAVPPAQLHRWLSNAV